ncbi:MAG: type III pantothenate kinase [Clostridia bacterium]|nr:type III pantothenate kinase [Clostridia bacterium]
MLLTIDIGNTNITLGLYKQDELCFVSRLATQRVRTRDEYAFELLNMFNLNALNPKQCKAAIISSVVPEISRDIGSAVKLTTGCTPKYIDNTIYTGLKIATDIPGQLGADMIVGAVAAIDKYPLPCLVIDLGTANKMFVIDKCGTFLGCTISAGVGLSLNALSSGASQLPAINIKAPEKIIGTETVGCMQSGAVYGTACMIDGMTDKFEKELGYPFASIIATGGYAKPIVKHCKRNIMIDENMLLDGLKSIYNKNL